MAKLSSSPWPLSLPIFFLLAPHRLLVGLDQLNSFSWLKFTKGLAVLFFLFWNIIYGKPVGQFFSTSYFLSLQEAINKGGEETLTAASRDLSTKWEEETGREVIPSEREGDSLAHQSFQKALFTEECQQYLTISVRYFSTSIQYFIASLFQFPSSVNFS